MDHTDKPSDGDLLHDDALDATLGKTEAKTKDAGAGPFGGAAVGSGAGADDKSEEQTQEGDPITTEPR